MNHNANPGKIENPGGPMLIETVRGAGYRFRGGVGA